MRFGANLKNLRKSKKISQEQLAEKVNVSRQSVSKWETGESYPEMNNLLELCKIFKCKINDLVNDSIIDVDSLSDDVKTKVISLKKEDQKKMKGLSKTITIIARIGKIACLIAIPFILISMITFPCLINNIEVKDNTISWQGNKAFLLQEKDNKINLKIKNVIIASATKDETNKVIIDILNNNSKIQIIGYLEVYLLTLGIAMYMLSTVLNHLSRLFDNLHKGETPFTLENVNHLKKMSWLMIVVIILSNIGGAMGSLLFTGNDIDIDIEMFDIVEILFLLSMSYIFEYGRLIQLETNGSIYEVENE